MASNRLLWTIDKFLYQPGVREGFSFSFSLSPQFVQLASVASINQPENRKQFNRLAIETVASKSYKLSPDHQLYFCDEKFGVQQINHPCGGGRWISIHFDDDALEEGAKGDTHNIDNSADQSLMLALWCFYVEYLEV